MKPNKFTIIGFTLIFLWLSFVTGVVIQTHNNVTKITKEKDELYELVVWELIRRESIRLSAYRDGAGHKTIGIGTRTKHLDTITLEQAFDSMHLKFAQIYDIVDKEFPNHKRNEKLAITLMAYNFGVTKLKVLGHWDRIKNREDDVVRMWKKYIYYLDYRTNRYEPSINLIRARNFEVALYQNDMAELNAQKNELKANAEEKIKKALAQ